MTGLILDHVDIVTSHICNNNCEHCIDKFIHTSNRMISMDTVDKFLSMIRMYTDAPLEVLLLGGEPTVMGKDKLIEMAEIIHRHGFKAMMSTNGKLKDRIISILPYYDSVQITVSSDEEIDFWRPYADKINIKICGDAELTMDKIRHFMDYAKDFYRRSVSMYFTEDFTELCRDEEVWAFLDTLEWARNGSYMYAFYGNTRFKKCIHGETNIVDEPTVPKVYPNGAYNKTWNDEELDDYIGKELGIKWENFRG